MEPLIPLRFSGAFFMIIYFCSASFSKGYKEVQKKLYL